VAEITARVALLGLGVAMSPVPIAGVLVVLLGKRARAGGLAIAAAWVLGNTVAIAVAIAFAGSLSVPKQGYDLPFEGLMSALLGIGLVVSAGLARRGRFRSDDPFAPPEWVNAVDRLSPSGGAFVAFTNATTSPKNLALAIVAGAAIQDATAFWAAPLAEALVYVACAATTIVTPVVIYFVFGTRAAALLGRARAFVTTRASAMMEITFMIVGVALMAKGILNLLG
jgi:hypothetical protein